MGFFNVVSTSQGLNLPGEAHEDAEGVGSKIREKEGGKPLEAGYSSVEGPVHGGIPTDVYVEVREIEGVRCREYRNLLARVAIVSSQLDYSDGDLVRVQVKPVESVEPLFRGVRVREGQKKKNN